MSVLIQIRRILERHWSIQAVFVMVVFIPSTLLIERGQAFLGTAAIAASVLFIVAIVLTSPPRQLARLERRARRELPRSDGPAVLIGTVMSTDEPIVAPDSKAACVAYWTRTLNKSDVPETTNEESTATVDFVMRCGDAMVSVEAARAHVLFDPARARRRTWIDTWIYEEQVARPGDAILVAGDLVHGPEGSPFRATARITGRRVIVGLIAPAPASDAPAQTAEPPSPPGAPR